MTPWALRLRTAALVVTLAIHAIVAAVAFRNAPEPATDFDRYYEIANSAGRPYVDYAVEHPIGTWLVFRLLASAPGGRASFGRGVVTANIVGHALIVSSLLWAWGIPAATYYAVVVTPISGLLFNRIDLWSMAAASLALAAWRRRWPALSGVALGLGTSFKLWPLVLIFSLYQSEKRGRAIGAFLLVVGAMAGLALLPAGIRAISDVLTFRRATGWQVESVVGSVIHLFSPAPIRLENDSWRVGAMGSSTSTLLFVAAAPLCLWSGWRGFSANRPGSAWLGAVAALLTLSALLSAQYVGWLVPGGALAWTEGNRRPAALAAAAVCLTELFWSDYGAVLAGSGLMPSVVVIRNLVLVVLAIDALRAIARASLPEPDLEP